MNTVADDEAVRLVERLRDATNSHDPDGVAACFTPDYRSETPLHPARSFTGRDQVRRNQEKIFTFVPDLTAELLRSTVDGTTIWTEWEHRGTRKDGSPHHMRGTIILGMRDGLACRGRFYLEPVEADGDDNNAALTGLGTQKRTSTRGHPRHGSRLPEGVESLLPRRLAVEAGVFPVRTMRGFGMA